jgi:hypothetical protein
MAFTKTAGSTTTTASEANLFDVTADKDYSCWLFLHNMTASETFVFKVYTLDSQTSTMRMYMTQTYTGVQTEPAVFINNVPAAQYRVSQQRTAGTDRAVTWLRIER